MKKTTLDKKFSLNYLNKSLNKNLILKRNLKILNFSMLKTLFFSSIQNLQKNKKTLQNLMNKLKLYQIKTIVVVSKIFIIIPDEFPQLNNVLGGSLF